MSGESSIIVEQQIVLLANQEASANLLDNLARMNLLVSGIRIVATPVNAALQPVTPNAGAAIGTAAIFGLASLLDFGLRLQTTYCTVPRRVPAELLRSPYYDSLSEPEDPTQITSNNNLSRVPQRALIWDFPEPLFVPAGAQMWADLLYNAADGANSWLWDRLLVQVTLFGRRADGMATPQTSRIPFVTTFRTPKMAIGEEGTLQEFRGADFQLQNHCKQPIVVQRLTAWNTAAGRMPTLLRYSTSQGKFINRELTPLLELHSNGALNLGTVLDPNEWIAVEGTIDSTPAREPYPNDDPSPITAVYEQQVLIGLVGWREVETRLLWGLPDRPLVALPVDLQAIKAPALPYVVDLPQIKPRYPLPPRPPLPLPRK